MSREDGYWLGYLYGNDGLSIEQFNALINQLLRSWSNDVASEFVRGYHEHINNQLHNN